jgi:hypothetical protein
LDQDCDGTVDESTLSGYLLYVTASSYNGNLGGRSGADTKCNSDTNKPSSCGGSGFAFISVNSSDEIQDFPTTKSINTAKMWYWQKGASSNIAASSWSDLIDGSISNAATSVGYSAVYTWTGSTAYGVLSSTHCTNWTSSSSGVTGTRGWSSQTGTSWLSADINLTCNNTFNLYCACPLYYYY